MSKLNVDAVEPSSATTLTLGASGDTIDVPSGATLDVTGATVSGLSAGKVLQVVQTVKTDTFTRTSSGGDVGDVTGLSVSITPSSTSNKVLVLANVMHGSASGQENYVKIVRDSTDVYVGDAAGSRQRMSASARESNTGGQSQAAMVFLDSPNTTSSVTYKIQAGAEGVNIVYINRSENDGDNATIARTASQITAMEIEA